MHPIAEIEIRGYHCDAYAHVNNARYLELLEESRWNAIALLVESGSFPDGLPGFYITHIDIDFIRGLKMGDTAQIGFKVDGFEGYELLASQEIHRKSDGKLCTRARLRFVLMDLKAGKKMEIDEDIKQIFLKFV